MVTGGAGKPGGLRADDAELAEARSSEFSKNANLALALDVQTNQLIKGIDQFVVLIKDQYEGPGPRIPLRRLVAPAFANSSSITFIGVTDENGNTAHVTIADVKQSNGVIHVIDKVLLPKS